MQWIHDIPAVLAAFLGSFVEFVEALTIVLAVGVTRGWRSAIIGALLATVALIAIVLAFGPNLSIIPIRILQLLIGILLLLFGLRWLRKAILRAAGKLNLHDEAKIFAHQTEALRAAERFRNRTIDREGFLASFNAVLIEGLEVVFIVIAVGATGKMLLPASLGALVAGLLVILLGLIFHQPLTRIPENKLKLAVGILLSSFGVFWTGEGLHIPWMENDWVILCLISGFLILALCAIQLVKRQMRLQRD